MIPKIGLLLIVASFQLLEAAGGKPNIVFLLVDDLGWGDFGCYGAKFNETPNIDKLAADGMRFSNAYSAATVCSPSRAAILSGCYPARLHLTDWIAGHNQPTAKLAIPDWKMKLDHERVLLPEALKMGGYSTAFFGKWHLMPHGRPDMKEHFPTHHGFDINIGGREWAQPKGPGQYFSPFGMPNLDDGKPGDYLTDKLTEAAIGFLDQTKRDTPFLLYFSYYTVHTPLMAPPALVAKYTAKAKDFKNDKNEFLNPARAGMIESLDASIGRIVAKLEEMGIAENTVIILTGDNGGDDPGTTGGLRDFKGWSHEGAVREPLIAKWPGKIARGSACDGMVIGTDFYPTLLEIAGLDPLPDQHKDGISIAPLLTGAKTALERKILYWHYPHYHRTKPYGAIRDGDWKLIEFFEDGRLELFDLKSDPYERKDLAEMKPGMAAELLAKLRKWRQDVDAQMPTPNPRHTSGKDGGNRNGKPAGK
jgi:arylsulfatase A-like enzyme